MKSAMLWALFCGCALAQTVVDGATYPRTDIGIQAAINATPRGGKVVLPAGDYVLSSYVGQQILIDKSMTLECEGWDAKMVVAASVGSSVDVVRIKGSSRDMDGVFIKGCMFMPEYGTPGRHAIEIETDTFSISKLHIEDNYFGSFGGYGIHSANTLTDGFYTSWIIRNAIKNGIQLNDAGDSIVIEDNVISGDNIGIDLDLVNAGGTNQPAMARLQGNNITAVGGCIKVRRAHNSRILNNFCEGRVGLQYSNGAHIDIDGAPGFTNEAIEIAGNKITPVANNPAQDGIRVNRASGTWIHNNFIANAHVGNGSRLYRITPSAIGTRISENFESPIGQSAAATIDDKGLDTHYARSATVRVMRDRAFTTLPWHPHALAWNLEMVDTDNLHTNDSTRLVAQVSGNYLVTGTVEFDTWWAGFRQAWIVKNSVTPPGYAHANTPGLANLETRLSVSDIVPLKAGEYVELYVYQDSGRPINVLGTNRTAFSMSLLP